MIALYILLGIVLLIAAILLIPASITIAYQENVSLAISVLGIRIRQMPKPKKPVKLSSYSKKALARQRKKDERKARRLLKKKANQDSKTKKEQEGSREPKSLLQNLSLIKRLAAVLLSKTAKHVRIEARRLVITVGTDDAAKTAILFGSVNQAAIALLEFLKQTGNLRQTRRSQIAVKADFTSDKTTADVKLVFSMRVWQLLDILLSTLKRLIKEKRKKANQTASPENTSKKSA